MTEDFWREAKCQGSDPELFFPQTLREGREAMELCNSCPIQRRCRKYGKAIGAVGIWGGRVQKIEVEGKTGLHLSLALRNQCRNGHPLAKNRTNERCIRCHSEMRKRERERAARYRAAKVSLIPPVEEQRRRSDRVAELASAGFTTSDIASATGLSVRTVQRYRNERKTA